MAIAITEEFNDDRGRLAFYDPYDQQTSLQVNNLKHVDIAPFDLDDAHWSNGTLGTFGDSFPALTWNIVSGPNSTQVVRDEPVDLLTDFEDDDVISVALPNFPTAQVNLAQSYFTLTSDPNGNFSGPQSISVPLSSSSVAITSGGTNEFRVARSAFAAIDLEHVYGVKLRITATGSGSVKLYAIRLLSKDWTYGAVDTNTLRGVLVKTPPVNGNLSAPYVRDNPIMWRSTGTLAEDPRPIDAEVGAVFNTGQFVDGVECSVTLYFRELTEDFLTQVDLNGYPQSFFNGKVQPDVGDAMFNPRTQEDLEGTPMVAERGQQLNNRTQYDIERMPDYLSASYIFASFKWNEARSLIQVGSSETSASVDAGYPYSFFALQEYTNYVLFAKIEENSLRVRLFEISDTVGEPLKLVYDTRLLDDSFLIKRRKGRFGWRADLPTDASLDSIRSRGEVYAEYISSQFESDTPIIGAELFVQTSPDEELFKTLASGFSNTAAVSQESRDSSRSTTGQSWKIENSGGLANQGFVSNEFLVRDFDNVTISFDIWYPKALIDANQPPNFQIVSDDKVRVGQLRQPRLYGDQWETVQFNLPFSDDMLSGSYRLSVTQPGTTPATWWIDKVSIKDRVVVWSGRAIAPDPWETNRAKWQPYRDVKNGQNQGILFDERGRYLQTRAKSYRPDGEINRIQVVPRYAPLGRLKFDAQNYYPGTGPDISFGDPVQIENLTYGFSADIVAGPSDNNLASVIWYFGDGQYGYGEDANHIYAEHGDYTVTAIAVDSRANRTSYTRDITI